MKVYIAWVQENDYETDSINLGVYSTVEKAKQRILDFINEFTSYWGDTWLSLECYDEEFRGTHDEPYLYGVDEFELNE